MDRSRLVVFSKMLWPEGSGGEHATRLIVEGILAKHFNVVVVSGTRNPVENALKRFAYVYWPALRSRFKPLEWLRLLSSFNAIRELVEKADIVYITSHTLLPLAIAVKRVKPNVKVIVHLHNYQPISYTSVKLYNREPSLSTEILVERFENGSIARAVATGLISWANQINALALHHADEILCVSRRQAEILMEHLPWLRSKTSVVYNPLPPLPKVEKRLSDKPTFLYLGGSSYVKGFHVLLKALPRLLHMGCKLVVTAVRRLGAEGFKLLKEVEAKYTQSLYVAGRFPYQKLIELHSIARGLLFPSISEEPLPYAVMESAALGTIPIASRVGGVPEIVEDTPAERFLFKPGDVNGLVDRVEILLSMSREEILDLGSRMSKAVEKRFSIDVIERELVRVFTT